MNYKKYIEDNTIRLEASRRGGGIEIDVSNLFGDGCKMTAYQNYLGGGMLGCVCSDYNFKQKKLSEKKQKVFDEITEELTKYFFAITNEEAEDYDDWNGQSYEQNKKMSSSSY